MRKQLLLAFVLLQGCAASKYAIVEDKEPVAKIALEGKTLIGIDAKGAWTWHRKPEEVVGLLLQFSAEQQKQIVALEAKVAALIAKMEIPRKP